MSEDGPTVAKPEEVFDPCRRALGICFVLFCRRYATAPRLAVFLNILQRRLGSATARLVHKREVGSNSYFSEQQEGLHDYWQVEWDGVNYLLPQPVEADRFDEFEGVFGVAVPAAGMPQPELLGNCIPASLASHEDDWVVAEPGSLSNGPPPDPSQLDELLSAITRDGHKTKTESPVVAVRPVALTQYVAAVDSPSKGNGFPDVGQMADAPAQGKVEEPTQTTPEHPVRTETKPEASWTESSTSVPQAASDVPTPELAMSEVSSALPSLITKGPRGSQAQVSEPSPPSVPTTKKTLLMAWASLILGLMPFGLFSGLAAVICGHAALKRSSREGGRRSRGVAIAGSVLGYLRLLLEFLIMINAK